VLLRELVSMEAAAVADGWDGDRYALVDTPDGTSLVWWSVWDSEAARDLFVQALRPALGKLPAAARLTARDLGGLPAAVLEVGDLEVAAPSILVGGQP
jgi:hypothetical protein